MSKNVLCFAVVAMVVMTTPVWADSLSGLADVTVIDGAIVSLRYADTEYVVADEDLVLGTTTRWYILNGVETLWVEGDPAPDATVPGSSNPKVGDVGSKADNFLFTLDGGTNISSIDGIDFQETIFPSLTDTFFLFERGGNDVGSWQAILEDGSLGPEIAFVRAADGGPYTDTGVSVNGQNAFGVVFTTDVPVMGVRINAPGHDTLSISTPKGEDVPVDAGPVDPGVEGLLAAYSFEGDASDISGNGLNGLLMGDPMFSAGQLGLALDLDGDGDYVDCGTNDALNNLTDAMTVSAWVNIRSVTTAWMAVVAKGETAWRLGVNNTTTGIHYAFSGGTRGWLAANSVTELPLGEWHHIGGTYDRGVGGTVYVDGIGETVNPDPGGIDTNQQPLLLGENPEATGRFFDGILDDVRIYDRALSEAEMMDLAGVQPNMLIASYGLDSAANDSSGNGLDGTIMGDPLFVDGKVGMALQLDGVDDYVDLGNPSSLDFGTGNFTVAAWINMTAIERGTVYAKGGDNSGGIRYTLAMGESNDNKMTLTTDDDATKIQARGATVVNDGLWHHVVGMRNGNTTLVYVDGVLDGMADLPEGYDLSGTSQANALIGAITDARDATGATLEKFFNGAIDDVRIYNYALSDAEVADLAGFVPAPPEVVDLLPNGGFESGAIAPYGIYGNATSEVVTDCVDAVVPEGPVEGAYCLHIVVPDAGANNWDVGMTDGSYTFLAGKTYTFSAFLKCKSGTLDFRMKPERGASPWEGYGDQVFTMTDTWQEFTVTTPVIGADVTPASPTFHFAFAPGDFWVDNVRLLESQ